jgi:hypothetical protein
MTDSDDSYERIVERIFESRRDSPVIVQIIKQVLGWIVCAQRPLKWREIQGAVCIDLDADLEQQQFDSSRELLDPPKALFASLVEVDDEGTVDLIHDSAREYVISPAHVLAKQTQANAGEVPYTQIIRETLRDTLFHGGAVYSIFEFPPNGPSSRRNRPEK